MKTYVVTGATSGIGFSTVKLLASTGAAVIGTGRSAERCILAKEQICAMTGNEQVHYIAADLAQQNEVRRLVSRVSEHLSEINAGALDGLVNNAGTFTYWLALTQDGVETQWAVNHMAPFILTNELMPLLEASQNGRVITVSSASHYGARLDRNDIQHCRNYNGLRTYGETKLANILFTLELNSRMEKSGKVRAAAVDPGLVNTEIGKKGTPRIARLVWDLRKRGGTCPERPAAGILCLLLDHSVMHSGDLYWKDSQPKKTSRCARDAESAKMLWDYSQRICGMEGIK